MISDMDTKLGDRKDACLTPISFENSYSPLCQSGRVVGDGHERRGPRCTLQCVPRCEGVRPYSIGWWNVSKRKSLHFSHPLFLVGSKDHALGVDGHSRASPVGLNCVAYLKKENIAKHGRKGKSKNFSTGGSSHGIDHRGGPGVHPSFLRRYRRALQPGRSYLPRLFFSGFCGRFHVQRRRRRRV